MKDPDPLDPIDAVSGWTGEYTTAPSQDDPSAAFRLEEELTSTTPAEGWTSAELSTIDTAEWELEDDPYSLFPSESPTSADPPAEHLQPRPAIAIELVASGAPTHANRGTTLVPKALGILAFFVVAGWVGVVTTIESSRESVGKQVVAEAPAAAEALMISLAAPPLGWSDEPVGRADGPVVPADDPADRADKARVEPVRRTDASDSPRIVTFNVATSPAAFRETTVDGRAGMAGLRETVEPPDRTTVTSEPLVLQREESPPQTTSPLSTSTSRTVTPGVELIHGAAAVPGIIAAVGMVPPSAAPRVVPPTTAPNVVPATAGIESVLSRYAAAFSALDAAGAKAVWPSVNERGLVRAFDGLEDQHFELGACAIAITPPRAVASCDGTARYVPKVGSKRVRSERRHWTFRLQQRADGWSIETVDFR